MGGVGGAPRSRPRSPGSATGSRGGAEAQRCPPSLVLRLGKVAMDDGRSATLATAHSAARGGALALALRYMVWLCSASEYSDNFDN